MITFLFVANHVCVVSTPFLSLDAVANMAGAGPHVEDNLEGMRLRA